MKAEEKLQLLEKLKVHQDPSTNQSSSLQILDGKDATDDGYSRFPNRFKMTSICGGHHHCFTDYDAQLHFRGRIIFRPFSLYIPAAVAGAEDFAAGADEIVPEEEEEAIGVAALGDEVPNADEDAGLTESPPAELSRGAGEEDERTRTRESDHVSSALCSVCNEIPS